ncbi:hypothetical protein ACT2EB_18265 [Salmonella enterica subsp. enterica serovar Typhimurium]|uniref:hypothetical protein n=1 Tax=Salmonella enterica TaxID=28901 RepID=UPI004028C526
MNIMKICQDPKCEVCNISQNTFCTLLSVYAYLTSKPGSNQKMWFKAHSSEHRELISCSGKVIAIWRASQKVWRERTDKDDVEDWEEYGNETGDHFIVDEGTVFQLATLYP